MSGEVRFVGTGRQDRPLPWRNVWTFRHSLPGELAAWFRTVSQPREVVLLGTGAPLHEQTAKAIVGLMVESWFPNAIRRSKPYGPRAVCRVDSGKLTVWPSCAAAARHFNCRRSEVFQLVDSGRLFWAQ